MTLRQAQDERELDELARAVEATLFAAEEPMSAEAISAHLGGAEVREALKALAAHYEKRGIHLVERGKRWQFQTAPDLAHLLRRGARAVAQALARGHRSAGESSPITSRSAGPRSRAIRGVQTSSGTLDVLMEAGWVRVVGRREVPGRPVIFATTPEFLSHFSLESRKDLPGIDELRAAGLLDPVDDAYEALTGGDEEGEAETVALESEGRNPLDGRAPERLSRPRRCHAGEMHMFGLSPIHLLLLAVVVLILFGRGRISEFMGDFGKGIKSFKQGMTEDEQKPAAPPPQITPAAGRRDRERKGA